MDAPPTLHDRPSEHCTYAPTQTPHVALQVNLLKKLIAKPTYKRKCFPHTHELDTENWDNINS